MADVNEGTQSPPIEVRNSEVHGRGVFATRNIKKGERLIEYLGDRVSHAEADRRYESKDENDSHTFLFIVDSKTVIDAGVDGNDARFFNQSCDPNCESTVEKRRVFIDALRDIDLVAACFELREGSDRARFLSPLLVLKIDVRVALVEFT